MPASLTHTDQGPIHLAQTVLRALSVSEVELPEEGLLELFLDILYQVSFRLENGQARTGQVLCVWHPSQAEAAPECLRLTHPVPLSASSLTSLLAGIEAPSALLVSAENGRPLVIQGIVPNSADFLQLGLLGVEILGPAHLKVDVGLDYPVELRRNRLHRSTRKVFERGPVRSRLAVLLKDLFPSVQARLPEEIAASPLLTAGSLLLPGGAVLMSELEWPEALEQLWMDALAHLLRRILAARSVCSVLLTPRRHTSPRKEDWLALPQEAEFPQLRHLLEERAAQAVTQQIQAAHSLSERLALRQDIPLGDLTLDEFPLRLDPPGLDPEITQAIQLLAALTRVDGLLRLSPQLELISFGGQPNTGSLPERVYLASSETASELSPISSRSFGPRNQALLRLCQQDPGAVGFAFTSDGDIRVMLWHEDKLIIWDNVQLPR